MIQLRLSSLSIVLSITLLLRHQALSLWDGSWPPFAAEIRLELWKVTEATRLPGRKRTWMQCVTLCCLSVAQQFCQLWLRLAQLHCRGIRWILGACARLAIRRGHFVMLSSNVEHRVCISNRVFSRSEFVAVSESSADLSVGCKATN